MTAGKDIYLHIGAHKTASTTIRRLLVGSVDELAARGVKLVPRDTIINSAFFEHLTKVVAGKAEPTPEAVPAAELAELRGYVDGPQKLVLMTSEDMFKRLPLQKFYDNIGLGLKLLQQLLPDDRVHVIFYTRVQAPYIESCYTQLVHMGRSFSFKKFVGKQIPEHLSWKKVCDEITDALGPDRLIAKPFEIIKGLGGDGFFVDFARAVGIPDPETLPLDEDVLQGKRGNRSYSDVAMKMALVAAPEISEKDNRLLRRFLQEHFSTDKYPRPRLFDAQDQAKVKAIYADENKALFDKYMPQYDGKALGYY